jgi:hypothetical protein
MKKDIIYVIKSVGLFLFLSLFPSCNKEPITPGNYKAGTLPVDDTTTWEWQYTNGGTLPNNTGNQLYDLVGTKWLLTKVVTAFSTSYPNDTLKFINNNNYILNSNAVRPYQISAGVASTNKTLTLYYFYPFGGSHYSGEVGQFFVTDGVINNCEFMNIQNTTSTVKAWFVKI